jgi:transcriptional regulator with XRE-family HTH domain
MIVRKLRLQRGWSQEQLAQFSGLSVRTIQRIERGQKAGVESLKSLAAVFEIQFDELQQESKMKSSESTVNSQTNKNISIEEEQVIEHVRDIKAFYNHVLKYIIIISIMFIVNFIFFPHYIWAGWAALGWGIGLISHGLSVFEIGSFFGAQWEKKQIEKRLGRKL